MATLEKEREEPVQTNASVSGAVPTPFPAEARAATASNNAKEQEQRDRSGSRPRESLINKFKRAMSRDRVPGAPAMTRRESLTATNTSTTSTPTVTERDENERGRSRAPPTTKLDSLSTTTTTDSATTGTAVGHQQQGHDKEGILKTISRSLSPSSRMTATATAPGERGRARFQTTGRGGAGNMLVSPDRGAGESGAQISSLDRSMTRGDESPEDIARARNAQAQAERSTSRSRGREPVLSSGRGGAGNLRSSSRGRTLEQALAERDEDDKERELLDKYAKEHAHDKVMLGRGGMGNSKKM